MFGNDRKTIGVFICRVVEDFQQDLCMGIAARAKELGYNVAFFTTFSDFMANTAFTNGEINIVDLPDYEQLDGVILALDTFFLPDMKRHLIEQIEKRCQCPVVCIREPHEKFYNMVADDTTALRTIMDHFIVGHKMKDICYLSGTKGQPDSDRRLAVFKQAMKEHNLPCGEEQIHHGTFWKYDGEPACRQFIDQRGKIPEAIVCGNDYMAISVCTELEKRGIQVPEQVLVSGFDGVWTSNVIHPALTTAEIPVRRMGEEAVELIFEVDGGIEHAKDTVFPVKVRLSESCGCQRLQRAERRKYVNEYYDAFENTRGANVDNTFLSIDLENVEGIDQMYHVVDRYLQNRHSCTGFHMCLKKGIADGLVEEESVPRHFSREMEMRISVHGEDSYGACCVPFRTSELIPVEVSQDDPQIYFFLSLHYREKCFGYVAAKFLEEGKIDRFYHAFVVNLGIAIQDMLVRRKMENLIDRLGDMYVRDGLTGLYNRRGFGKYSKEIIRDARAEKADVFVIGIDMDGLKEINDNYGHAEGDAAIVAVANALKSATRDGEVCGRMGGDEFSVIGICDEENQVKEFMQCFREQLVIENEKIQRKYEVQASYGYVISKSSSEISLDEMMQISDDRMYEAKVKRKKCRKV